MRTLKSTFGLAMIFAISATVNAEGWKVSSNGNSWVKPCSHSAARPTCDAPAACDAANGLCGYEHDDGECDNGCSDGCRGPILCNGKCCWDAGYGPELTHRRGTLFQWSYGTSFGGGPDFDNALVTDRPTFTQASSTVGQGVAQLEFGYTYTYSEDNDVRVSHESVGEPLLRYGILADWMELRLGAFPTVQETRDPSPGNTISGIQDLYIGVKWALTPQEGCLPEMAAVTEATIPIGDGEVINGDDPFSNDEFLPGCNFLYSWDLTDLISLAGSTAMRRGKDDVTHQTFTELSQSALIRLSFTEKFGAFNEFFATFPSGADTELPKYFYNGGLTLLLTNDVQWDFRAGAGLNRNAEDYFVGTGLSIRFQ